MNKSLLFAALVTITPTAACQVLPQDVSNSYYSEMWNVYNTHRKINYVTVPPWINVNGTSGWPILFEANITPYFILFRGRDDGGYGYSRPQVKSLMVYFNPEMTMRMYLEEPMGKPTNSLPVLPINFAPRLSVVKFFHRSAVPNNVDSFTKYNFLEFTIAHYSNGQENPHYLKGIVAPNGDSIPNFTSGNFSTNYLRLSYTRGFLDKKYNIYSANAYVQNDGGVGGVFTYDKAQLRSYGKWRVGATLQFQSKKARMGSKTQKTMLVRDTVEKTLDKFNAIRLRRDYFATWLLRITTEVIADNVSKYPSSNKNVFSLRAQLIWHPLNWRNFGLMTEYYHGRDFYNIRFYHSIDQIKFGIIADPNFYLPRNTYP